MYWVYTLAQPSGPVLNRQEQTRMEKNATVKIIS